MRAVLVVGNSDGIGLAVTHALLGRGERVVGISRSSSPIAHASYRHEVQDVAEPAYPGLLRRLHAEEHFGACIYCAGIGSGLKLPDLSKEAHVIDVNLTAMIRTLEVLVPYWIERRDGHFIGLSSLSDTIYVSEAPSYAASKAAFSNYLVSMAFALRKFDVAVTNVRFGFVDTKMAKAPVKPLMMTPDRAAGYVLKALARRPMQVSAPRGMAIAVWVLRRLQYLMIR